MPNAAGAAVPAAASAGSSAETSSAGSSAAGTSSTAISSAGLVGGDLGGGQLCGRDLGGGDLRGDLGFGSHVTTNRGVGCLVGGDRRLIGAEQQLGELIGRGCLGRAGLRCSWLSRGLWRRHLRGRGLLGRPPSAHWRRRWLRLTGRLRLNGWLAHNGWLRRNVSSAPEVEGFVVRIKFRKVGHAWRTFRRQAVRRPRLGPQGPPSPPGATVVVRADKRSTRKSWSSADQFARGRVTHSRRRQPGRPTDRPLVRPRHATDPAPSGSPWGVGGS